MLEFPRTALRDPVAGSAVFAVFPTNFSVVGITSSAEILGRQWFGGVENSESDRCSAAVSRCFHDTKPRIVSMSMMPTGRRITGNLHARLIEPAIYVNSQNKFLAHRGLPINPFAPP
jgi:hypothetical protein